MRSRLLFAALLAFTAANAWAGLPVRVANAAEVIVLDGDGDESTETTSSETPVDPGDEVNPCAPETFNADECITPE
jgi:hypothetical protein